MRCSRTSCFAVVCFLLLLAFSAPTWAQTITTFDVPGAGTLADQGAKAGVINTPGEIGGVYTDSAGVYHGFLRSTSGTITDVNVTGAGTSDGEGTADNAGWINDSGVATSEYIDSGGVYHGFVLAANGTITTFDVSGAGTGIDEGTKPRWINSSGEIVGWYLDSGGVRHGFLRTSGGSITTFDVTGAGTSNDSGTSPISVNDSGTIAGYYFDSGGVVHGFVRAANGTITTFDAPGAGTGIFQGTAAGVFDTAGDIVAYYIDAGGVDHGYLRAANGTFTSFDVPGAGTSKGQGTTPNDVNGAGVIVGNYLDSGGVSHGFERAVNGTITTIDIPAAGTGINEGTYGNAINASGEIVGHYVDSGGVKHGFFRTGSGGLQAQSITFPVIPTKTYGNAPFALTATASSGLAVTYVSNSTSVCTVDASTLTIVGAGSCSVTASQAGNATYAAAAPVNQMFAVDPAALVANANDASAAFGAAIPTLTGTLTGVVGSDGITASYSTSATQGSAVGTYPVTPTLHDPNNKLSNYSVRLGDGGLTIYNTSSGALALFFSSNSATSGGSSFTLTVNGGNLVSGSKVFWNGMYRATTFVSSTQLAVTILASDIATAGTDLITVSNPAPNASLSAAQPFLVQSANPVAEITSASISAAGGGNYVLTLSGSGFIPASTVQWNGTSITTTYMSPWQVSAVVTGADYGSLPATVTVENPAGASAGFELI